MCLSVKKMVNFKRNIEWTIPLHYTFVMVNKSEYSFLSIMPTFVSPNTTQHIVITISNCFFLSISIFYNTLPVKLPNCKILRIHWTVTEQLHCCKCLLPWELSTSFSRLFSPVIFFICLDWTFSPPQISSLYKCI